MNRTQRIALLALVSTAAACGDTTVGPSAQTSNAHGIAVSGVSAELSYWKTATFTITIDPRRASIVNLGSGNKVSFPAGSLCDPATSSYGPTEWDAPCAAARAPVVETVNAWLDASGHPQVDFSPHLRFVPSASSDGWVMLTLGDRAAAADPAFNILYCSDPSAICMDESKSDPTLATVHEPLPGRLVRHLKHFSGYLVGAGDTERGGGIAWDNAWDKRAPAAGNLPAPASPSRARVVQPPTEPPAGAKARSGYILVSG